MSTPRPLIAVSSVPRDYSTGYGPDSGGTITNGFIEQVTRAGGVPIMLPVVPAELAVAQLEDAQALVLAGGQDLALPMPGKDDSERWIDPARDEHELALWREAERRGLPTLAVCRGLQLVNHARGGALIPHLDGHDAGERHERDPHPVTIEPGSLLARACGAERIEVNTIHHQAVAEPGRGLRVTASAPDGTIEALELEDGSMWFLGVQWHPELMGPAPGGQGLFDELVLAALERPQPAVSATR